MVAIVGILIMQVSELINLSVLLVNFQQYGILVCGKRFSRYFLLHYDYFRCNLFKTKLEFV